MNSLLFTNFYAKIRRFWQTILAPSQQIDLIIMTQTSPSTVKDFL